MILLGASHASFLLLDGGKLALRPVFNTSVSNECAMTSGEYRWQACIPGEFPRAPSVGPHHGVAPTPPTARCAVLPQLGQPTGTRQLPNNPPPEPESRTRDAETKTHQSPRPRLPHRTPTRPQPRPTRRRPTTLRGATVSQSAKPDGSCGVGSRRGTAAGRDCAGPGVGEAGADRSRTPLAVCCVRTAQSARTP